MNNNKNKPSYTGVKNPYSYTFSIEEIDGGVVPNLFEAYKALKKLEYYRINTTNNRDISAQYTTSFHFYKGLSWLFIVFYVIMNDFLKIDIGPWSTIPLETCVTNNLKNGAFYLILLPLIVSFLIYIVKLIYCKTKSDVYYKKAKEFETQMKEFYEENDSLYSFIPEKYRNSDDIGRMIGAFKERRATSLAEAFNIADQASRKYTGKDFTSMYGDYASFDS